MGTLGPTNPLRCYGLSRYERICQRLSIRRLCSNPSIYNLRYMQRLYSMFPFGSVGVALIFLRILVAATYVVDGSAHWTLVSSTPTFLLYSVPALLLCLGLLTPFCAVLCVFVRLVLVLSIGSMDVFHVFTSGLMSASLALLGPGAYSVDAALFGRRRLTR